MVQETYDAWTLDEDLLFISLDIAKAFDSVWHEGLLFKLGMGGVRGRLLRWCRNYLMGRCAQVKFLGLLSERYDLKSGVPQRGCLSPILFLVFIDDVVSDLPEDARVALRGLQRHLFADDTGLSTRLPLTQVERDKVLEGARVSLRRITEWGKLWRMDFAPAKTVLTVFTRNETVDWQTTTAVTREECDSLMVPVPNSLEVQRKSTLGKVRRLPECDFTVPMAGVEVPTNWDPAKSRFLGAFLDYRLTGEWHVATIAKRAEKRSRVLNSLLRPRCGPSRWMLTHYYTQWVRPVMEHCPEFLVTLDRRLLKKLDKCTTGSTSPVPRATARETGPTCSS